jgi:hypothetical protein
VRQAFELELAERGEVLDDNLYTTPGGTAISAVLMLKARAVNALLIEMSMLPSLAPSIRMWASRFPRLHLATDSGVAAATVLAGPALAHH